MTKKAKAPPVHPPAGFEPPAVIGLDISLTNTGIVAPCKVGLKAIAHSVKPHDRLRGVERLAWI